MSLTYDVITATVTAAMVGNEFAVAAFIHPQLQRLNEHANAYMASLLANVLGRWMPLWYFLAFLLMIGAFFEHRPLSPGSTLLILFALVLWAIVIGVTVIVLVPINNRIARLNPMEPYDGWRNDRDRWDRLHRIRVALLLASVLLLITGLLHAAITSSH